MDVARKSRRRRPILAAALALALGALVIAGGLLLRTGRAAAATSVERTTVWTERVRRGPLVRQVPAQGTLAPERLQWLSATTAARVAEVRVHRGSSVEPDDVVLTLENAEIELATLEAERQAATAAALLVQLDVRTESEQMLSAAGVAMLRADAAEARGRSAAAERLATEGLMSALDQADARTKAKGLGERLELEERRRLVLEGGRARQLTAQRAEVERLREIAAFRRRQLASLQVRAGVRGIVQDVPLERGQWVATGAVLAKIAEPNRLKADVRVAESYAKDVRPGLAVRFESPAGLRGRVERVDPAVVAGAVRVEVTLEGELPAGARAEQSVSGYVEIDRVADALVVARPAGAKDGTLATVFRLEAGGGFATRVTASLGRGSAREVEIVGGLAEGDEIVVSDSSSWDATDRIKLR